MTRNTNISRIQRQNSPVLPAGDPRLGSRVGQRDMRQAGKEDHPSDIALAWKATYQSLKSKLPFFWNVRIKGWDVLQCWRIVSSAVETGG